ncbi:Hint domain-containing protein [Sphingobium yanoikuyae]|uniref:Hint domain-containing protein n=1 Tax=Sphingobium yanoikuyae TaxID=13690 RepID=UPI002FDE6012
MPGIIDNGASGLQSTGSNASPSLYEGDAAALAGKDFPANYFYNVSISSVSSSSVNGVYTNTGSVSGFSQSTSISGTVGIVDATSGKITIGGNPFTIMGSTADGQYLVVGNEVTQDIGGISFNRLEVSAVLANDGQLPQGTLNFATANNYNAPNPVCFVRGTLIKTTEGYKPIESISVGELLETSSGDILPAMWLGHRTVRCDEKGFSTGNHPVRIRAGALGDGKPFKDLLVSPGHRIHLALFEDVLVPASALVNGSTIVTDAVGSVEYWHVECERHAAIFANGITAETYVDAANRSFFGDGQVADLFPVAAEGAHGKECFPVISEGSALEAIRQLINSRAIALGWTVGSIGSDVSLDDGAQSHRAYFQNENLLAFRINKPAGDLVLRSNVEVPALVDPSSGDTRTLGVLVVGGAVIGDCGTVRHLDVASMIWPGFYGPEHSATASWRWTDGAAKLPAELFDGLREPITVRLDTPAESRRAWLPPMAEVALAS